jgi:hypothetical protein
MNRFLSQAIAYGVFIAVLGIFSVWPSYRVLGEQEAIVSITFSHAADRVEECRRLTQEELNELPPNMRKPEDCPRERHPVHVELRIDDTLVYSETALPSGLWSDGKANIYRRVTVNAGEHGLYAGMNNSGTDTGFDFELRQDVTVLPGQNLVITFDDLHQTFLIE